jgi:hypothetical protein
MLGNPIEQKISKDDFTCAVFGIFFATIPLSSIIGKAFTYLVKDKELKDIGERKGR